MSDEGITQPRPRAVRPEPERIDPLRAGWKPSPPPPSSPPPPPHAPSEVSQVVADAVRIGYEVIGENLKQGRAAADRHSSGEYRAENATDDLATLGKRLIQLSRDLSTTGFDLLGAVLRDPVLQDAVARHVPPAPPPPDPGRRTGPMTLVCAFRGPDAARASAAPVVLQPPEKPAVPTLAALHGSDPSLPPLTRVAFAAAQVGTGLVAHVTIPGGHPAGVYHGVILDAVGHQSLGALTVVIVAA